MSDAANSANPAKTEINLDELEVEILIIAQNVSVLTQSATFLSRRGWPTTVIDNIGKAIEFIADRKPDFVCLSLNHSNPGISKLPELIVQTFNLYCIGFSEVLDATSSSRLQQAKIRHKIQGKASGPNFHRSIRKILAERFNVPVTEKNLESKAPKGPQTKLFKGENTNDSGGSVAQEGGGPGEMHEAEMDGVEADDSAFVIAPQTKRISLKALSAPGGSAASGNLLAGEDLGEMQKMAARLSAEEVANFKKNVLGEEPQSVHVPPEPIPVRSGMDGDSSTKQLAGAVESAMASVCSHPMNELANPIHAIQDLAVLPVDSAEASGYLVFAWEGDAAAKEQFLVQIEGSIRHTFNSMGMAGRVEKGFWLQVPPVEFKNWIGEKSPFGFSLPHQKAEVGVAFIPMSKPLPQVKPVPNADDMFVIEIDEIEPGHPINFKAYLHFDKNQKYFLYLRNGRPLQPEQKQRLMEKGIREFFMKSVDVQNVRSFIALSFLEQNIKEFVGKKKAS